MSDRPTNLHMSSMLIGIVECMVILTLGYCCHCCPVDNFDINKLWQYVHCYVVPIKQIELRERERERGRERKRERENFAVHFFQVNRKCYFLLVSPFNVIVADFQSSGRSIWKAIVLPNGKPIAPIE